MPTPDNSMPDFSDVRSGASSSAPETKAAPQQQYTVKRGDSLSKIAKHIYVHSTVLPRESPFKPFYDRIKADPAWQAHTLPCGHDAMLDLPDETTALLESALN